MTTPFVVLNSDGKKKERRLIPKLVATFVSASSQEQRTDSAQTKNTLLIILPLQLSVILNVCFLIKPNCKICVNDQQKAFT
jgi:hypothetical protein